MKFYRKHLLEAEQFDGSDKMVKKYNITPPMPLDPDYTINTMEGDMVLGVGDWIATGAKGEHWAISDDVFKKTYAELPVIPKAVADWIEKCKNDGTSVGDMLCSERRPEKMRDWMALTPGTYEFNQRRYKEHQELVARAWLDGFQTED